MKLEAATRLRLIASKDVLGDVAERITQTFNLTLKGKKLSDSAFTASVAVGPMKATMIPRMDRQYGKGKKYGDDVFVWSSNGTSIKLSFALPPREELNHIEITSK